MPGTCRGYGSEHKGHRSSFLGAYTHEGDNYTNVVIVMKLIREKYRVTGQHENRKRSNFQL